MMNTNLSAKECAPAIRLRARRRAVPHRSPGEKPDTSKHQKQEHRKMEAAPLLVEPALLGFLSDAQSPSARAAPTPRSSTSHPLGPARRRAGYGCRLSPSTDSGDNFDPPYVPYESALSWHSRQTRPSDRGRDGVPHICPRIVWDTRRSDHPFLRFLVANTIGHSARQNGFGYSIVRRSARQSPKVVDNDHPTTDSRDSRLLPERSRTPRSTALPKRWSPTMRRSRGHDHT